MSRIFSALVKVGEDRGQYGRLSSSSSDRVFDRGVIISVLDTLVQSMSGEFGQTLRYLPEAAFIMSRYSTNHSGSTASTKQRLFPCGSFRISPL